jgi:hypothetical protein
MNPSDVITPADPAIYHATLAYAFHNFTEAERLARQLIDTSARSASQGSEVMFFCDGLKVPRLIGSVKVTETHPSLLRRLA